MSYKITDLPPTNIIYPVDVFPIVNVTANSGKGTTKQVSGSTLTQFISANILQDSNRAYASKSDLQSLSANIYNELYEDLSSIIASVSSALQNQIYPIGCIETTTLSANPSIRLGFGTWSLYGQGRTLVGVNSADSDFNAVGKTGGSKTHQLTINEMPRHNHPFFLRMDDDNGDFNGAVRKTDGSPDGSRYAYGNEAVENAGGNGAHNNLQPYVTVYFWRRTA